MKVRKRLEELGRWFLRGCCLHGRRDGGGSHCGHGDGEEVEEEVNGGPGGVEGEEEEV